MFTIESSRSARESRSLTWTGILPETPGRRIGQERPPRPPDERPWRPRTGERGGDQDTLPAVRIGSHHRRSQPALPRRLLQLRHPLDPGRPRATGNQERPHDPARIASARRPRTSPPASTPLVPPPVCGLSRQLRCSACPTAVVVPLSAQLPRHGKPGVDLASFSSARRRSFSISMLDLPSSASISS